MWQELSIHTLGAATGTGLLWKTCLREVFFFEPGTAELVPGTLTGQEAHRYLVEVCAGLHSPLFGETEVFGQFRAFRAAQSWDPRWLELLDAVEEDVRKVRREHLRDTGSQSYGSLARRHLPEGERVVLVGGGRLAADLLPWLGSREVTVAVREPSRVTFARAVSFADLASVRDAHWLIAAPVTNEQLAAWWNATPARSVLDFRGEDAFSAPPAGCDRYLALTALYAELESVRALHARKREEALAFARELTDRRALAVVYRPYGWEDAFA